MYIMRSSDRSALNKAYLMASDLTNSKLMIKQELEKMKKYFFPSYEEVAYNKDKFYYAFISGMACFFEAHSLEETIELAADLKREFIVTLIAVTIAKAFYLYSSTSEDYINSCFKRYNVDLTYKDIIDFEDFILYKKGGE